MRLRIKPLRFLLLLVGCLALTYAAWKPLAPAWAQLLLGASRLGIWGTEFSSDPAWSHPTALFIEPQRSPTAIFYVQQNLFLSAPPPAGTSMRDWLQSTPGVVRIPPQGIPAEWVMANLVLLIPLMLATPAPSWGAKAARLALAVGVALVLQVFDVVVGIKAFYAATFAGVWSPFMARTYQFLDAFVQSWDTQLFPFVIWAGIHLKELLPTAVGTATVAPQAPRAERRRQGRR